ncbi:ABC-2 family transporter protein [Candidatus Parcubacteria bacterium]|nr:ABC-2 family transporter protein [Candidatus Parcubacteria bacterium]
MIKTAINFLKQELDQFVMFSKVEWQKVLTWRVSVFVYRISEVLETSILVSMWIFIFAQGSGLIKGYTMNEMVTYVLIGGLCTGFTRNFIHGSISRDIEKGDLSLFLVKPVSYIKFNIYSEFGGLILTFCVSLISQIFVILLFADKFILNKDYVTLILMFAMLVFAFFIEILIGLLVGLVAFWTDEVNGVQNLMFIIKKFFAGVYFPLSLLPASLTFIGFYLPFAYSFFVPAQLYLGKIDANVALKGLGIQLVWILILSFIVRLVWSRGLKRYEAVGS